jgi:hypothetical protein
LVFPWRLQLRIVFGRKWNRLKYEKNTDNVEQAMMLDNTMGRDTYKKTEYPAWRCGVVEATMEAFRSKTSFGRLKRRSSITSTR